IIDLTGAVQTVLLPNSLRSMTWLSWSHAGLDKLAFAWDNGTAMDLYTMATTTGSTATLLVSSVGSKAPVWSPNNTTLVYAARNSINNDQPPTNKVTVATGAVIVVGTIQYGDWKTP